MWLRSWLNWRIELCTVSSLFRCAVTWEVLCPPLYIDAWWYIGGSHKWKKKGKGTTLSWGDAASASLGVMLQNVLGQYKRDWACCRAVPVNWQPVFWNLCKYLTCWASSLRKTAKCWNLTCLKAPVPVSFSVCTSWFRTETSSWKILGEVNNCAEENLMTTSYWQKLALPWSSARFWKEIPSLIS